MVQVRDSNTWLGETVIDMEKRACIQQIFKRQTGGSWGLSRHGGKESTLYEDLQISVPSYLLVHSFPQRKCVTLCLKAGLAEVGSLCMHAQSRSVVSSSLQLQTVALQAPLSMGFSRQESWRGLPCPPPGDLPHPGIKLKPPALAGAFFSHWATWEALGLGVKVVKCRNFQL